MSYPKINAPLTARRGFLPSDSVVFNLTPQAGGILLSWSSLPTGMTIAHSVFVGKEYGDAATRYHDREDIPSPLCSAQTLNCIPDPNTVQPPDYAHDCWSGISDTPIAFAQPFDTSGTLLGVTELFIPYNKFQGAGNTCAVQTDGLEALYYCELTQMSGASAIKTKWTFKYTSPSAEFPTCGVGEVVVPPPAPTPPANTQPGKGNEKKK